MKSEAGMDSAGASKHWTYEPPPKREGNEGKEREKLVKKFIEVCGKGSQNRIFEFVDDCDLYEWEMEWPPMANERSRRGRTPLIAAACNGTPGAVDCLITLKADVDTRDPSGYTPLRYALVNGKTEAMEILLGHGADPDAADLCGMTLLMRAAKLQTGGEKVVTMLLEHGAMINHGGGSGSMALQASAYTGQVSAMHALLRNVHTPGVGEEPNGEDMVAEERVSLRPLVHVVQGAVKGLDDFHDVSSKMHDHGKMKEVHEQRPKSRKDIKTVKDAVKTVKSEQSVANVLTGLLGAKTKAKVGKTALMCAADVGNLPVIKTLLAAKADLQMKDLYGRTALDFAAAAKQQESIKLLVEAGVHLEKLNVRELVEADNQQIVNQLLYHGLQADAEDEFDLTLLSYWAAADNPEAMELLLSKGANPRRTDRSGCSPLMLAAEKGSLKAMQVLLDVGVKVDQADKFGETALMHAARTHGGEASIRFLLDAKADLNQMDRTGRNAVSHAAANDCIEVVSLLMSEFGARVPEATIDAHEQNGSFWLSALVKQEHMAKEHKQWQDDEDEQLERERLGELAESWLAQ